MTSARLASQRIGPHEFHLEEPDLFVVRFDGDLRAEHITRMFELADVFVRERNLSRIFVLQDFARLKAINPSVREAMSKDPRTILLAAVACFGASFTVRVLLNAIQKAIRFFRGEAGQLLFFATEAEARAWLKTLREPHRITAEGSSG